jgi:hypothetical protein
MTFLNKFINNPASDEPELNEYDIIFSALGSRFGVFQNEGIIYIGGQYNTRIDADLWKETGGLPPFTSSYTATGKDKCTCFDTERTSPSNRMIFGTGSDYGTIIGQVLEWDGSSATQLYAGSNNCIYGVVSSDQTIYFLERDSTGTTYFSKLSPTNVYTQIQTVALSTYVAIADVWGKIYTFRGIFPNIFVVEVWNYGDPTTLNRSFTVSPAATGASTWWRFLYYSPTLDLLFFFHLNGGVIYTINSSDVVTNQTSITIPTGSVCSGLTEYNGKFVVSSTGATEELYEVPFSLASITAISGTALPRGAADLKVHNGYVYLCDATTPFPYTSLSIWRYSD